MIFTSSVRTINMLMLPFLWSGSALAELATPIVGEQLGQAIGGGAFAAGSHLLHGDVEGAAKSTLFTALNHAAETVGLPVTLSETHGQSAGGVFGLGNTVQSTWHRVNGNVGVGIPTVAVGVHHESSQSTVVSGGHVIDRTDFSQGVHMGAVGVNVGVGIAHGREVSDRRNYVQGKLSVAEQFEHEFSGQLRLSVSVANRRSEATLIPAFNSEKHISQVKRNVDGSALEKRFTPLSDDVKASLLFQPDVRVHYFKQWALSPHPQWRRLNHTANESKH
jgi:hypothetical protein